MVTKFTIVYPNADFARKYTEVVEKAFIDGHNPELLRSAAHVTETVDKMVSGDYTVSITNSKDLYNLSEAVADGKTFENAKFKIVNDLEVDYDFEPIDNIADENPLLPCFKGEITAEENTKVNVYNKGLNKYSEKAFSILLDGEVKNLTCVPTQEIFDMTDKAGKLLSYTFDSKYTYAEKINAKDAPKAANYIKYGANDEGALKLPLSKNGLLNIYLSVNYTAEELAMHKASYDAALPEDSTKELAIKLTFMATNGTPQNNCNSQLGINSLFGKMGYVAENTWADITKDRWMSHVVSVEEFSQTYVADNKVRVLYNAGEYDIYLGKAEFVEWDFEKDFDMNYDYKFEISEENAKKLQAEMVLQRQLIKKICLQIFFIKLNIENHITE